MRIVPRHVLHEERERAIAKVIAIVASVGGSSHVGAGTRRSRNTAADARVLRMIPVVAEGVGGTIPHTQPLQELLSRESRLERHGLHVVR